MHKAREIGTDFALFVIGLARQNDFYIMRASLEAFIATREFILAKKVQAYVRLRVAAGSG